MSDSVTISIPVQWGDMDAFGHVNNVQYFRWFESARIAMFEALGVLTKGATGIGPILATTSCDFLAAVVYPGSVRVSARVSRIGETSLVLDYEVRDDQSEETVYARGSSVVVMIDYRTGQKVRVPEDVRAAIASLGSR